MQSQIRGSAWTWLALVTWVGASAFLVSVVGCGQPSAKPEKPAASSAKTTPAPATEAAAPAKETAASPTADSPKATAASPEVPLGLPPLAIPDDNPMTPEKIELGKMLYFDKRVSKDGTVACATCHDPKMAWAEHTPTSTGINKQVGGRNSPTVINAAYAPAQFWDGRAATLEDQASGPVGNPIEMGHSMQAMVNEFKKIPEYEKYFQKVFGTGVTEKGFVQAIAAFERTILSGASPYDRYTTKKDPNALTDAQKRGLELFDANCSTCHSQPLFSNFRYYNVGIGMDKPKPDEGRKDVTKKDSDLGKFRTPALREVANTAPYFHDGSVARLENAVAIMADGGKDNPNLSAQVKSIREAKLSAADKKDIFEFLKALSGKYPIVEPPKLP
jgi:cytochrome c peroxidase